MLSYAGCVVPGIDSKILTPQIESSLSVSL